MRVTVAEDSGLYRDLLTRTLTNAGHRVTTAGSATELLAVAESTRPDLVLTDIRMPPTHTDDGLRAALRIRERQPRVGIVLLSNHGEVAYALQLVNTLRERAGYLLKERATGDRELLDTLDRVAAGGLVIDPEIVALLVNRPRGTANPLRRLTGRELDTLKLMAEGLGNSAIARQLGVTTSTVEKHATAVFRKLGLGGDQGSVGDENARVSAVLTYLRHSGRLPHT